MTMRLAALLAVFAAILLPAPARSEGGRSVALILDASGSMKAMLPSGQSRIDAAKDAVETLVTGLPEGLRLALRAYGHQSPARAKNCRDTQLLTGFAPVGANRAEVIRRARALTAQGYTPISHVLELAAGDLKAEAAAASRVVILVSDGKETCEGDPCAVAKALAAADAGLVIHTIGFAVDVAARYQLQCIARVARGTYFDADSLGKLTESLSMAVRSRAVAPAVSVPAAGRKPGGIRLAAPSATRHEVISVETGKVVRHLSSLSAFVDLPAGFYNVRFGNQFWRSIEVRDGETAEIATAIVELPAASYRGHEIRDWETGELVEKLSSSRTSANLLPSSYTIAFGARQVPFTLEPGRRLVIDAVSVTIRGLPVNARTIRDEAGEPIAEVSAIASSVTLPPGRYVLDLGAQSRPFEVKSGAALELDLR
ncbi:vWA domain-containing protein [Rhabdaerophilum calidifontis]|uniref:vWA domain-containing protein n=1 Tax=Rhabdaerophilum calidifontis TaxID=2604328 RepID=UPI0012392E9F|nr:VWA domain-containing protein [Rhabdaerophilum calidifontis]